MRPARDFTPPPDTNETGDVRNAYVRLWPYVGKVVNKIARSIGKDEDEVKDLVQEARFELFRIDASRCNPKKERDILILQRTLARHMLKEAKKNQGSQSVEIPSDLKKLLGGNIDGELH